MIKPMTFVFSTIVFLFITAGTAFAQTNVAVIVATKGDVQIFRNADTSPAGPFLLYEGKKYAYEKAKIGKKLLANEIIHSADDGKAKIVYPNGDYLVIGPGTSMVMPTEAKAEAKSDSVIIKLFYGKVRSVISKEGPRNRMRVTTPASVAGVRGTDFFINHSLINNGTNLTVVRGEVAVKPLAENAKVVSVKKGFSVTTDKNNTPEVKEATKEQLVQIQADSTLKDNAIEIAELTPDAQKEIKDLNEKAKEAALVDVKKDDPVLYEQLKNQKDADIQAVNSAVVAKLFEAAPSVTKKKPTREEIEAMDGDVYDKYFKAPDKKK
jgi:hypothetical protein